MRLSRLVLPVFAAACTFTSTPKQSRTAPLRPSTRCAPTPARTASPKTSYADNVTPGFGAATVYAPTGTSGQTFGVVSFSPGFTENQSAVDWIARRTATFGFVTIAFNVNNTFLDFPTQRSEQLLAALDFVTGTSNQRNLADASREAVAGHSMGGGAALEAARARPALKAAVGLAQWDPQISFSDVTVPTLAVASQNDFIAPVNNNARYHYNSLPGTTPKAYAEMKASVTCRRTTRAPASARRPSLAQSATSTVTRATRRSSAAPTPACRTES